MVFVTHSCIICNQFIDQICLCLKTLVKLEDVLQCYFGETNGPFVLVSTKISNWGPSRKAVRRQILTALLSFNWALVLPFNPEPRLQFRPRICTSAGVPERPADFGSKAFLRIPSKGLHPFLWEEITRQPGKNGKESSQLITVRRLTQFPLAV